MWWSSACVLAAMIAVSAPAVLVSGRNPTGPWISISQAYRDNPPSLPARHGLSIAQTVSIVLTILFVAGIMSSLVARRAKGAMISPNLIYGSPTAQQYVIARWIDANLRPGDGSIGFFFLGVAYDLPRFEIADFLGKADESIAVSKVKQGPPGHNKWDIDKTLAKWKPQAIVPAGPSDPALAETRENARRHAPDLLFNDTISKDFTYCYVPDSTAGVHDRWGFFLRRDIAALHLDQLRCSWDGREALGGKARWSLFRTGRVPYSCLLAYGCYRRGETARRDSGRTRTGESSIAIDRVDGNGAFLVGNVDEFSCSVEVDTEGLRAGGNGTRRVGSA
jgi:hypothetical protein